MKITNLEEAGKLFEDVKRIEAFITTIQGIAAVVSEKKSVSLLRLKVTDLDKRDQEENKIQFDEHGFIVTKSDKEKLVMESPFSVMFGSFQIGTGRHQAKPVEETNLDCELTEMETMKLLKMLIEEKYRQRDEVVDKLVKLGFSR